MQRIDADSLADALERGGAVFDTRPAAVAHGDRLEGARVLTLEAVQAGELPDLPKDEEIVLVCERGVISELVGLYLEAAGFTNVRNVAGGLLAFRRLRNGKR